MYCFVNKEFLQIEVIDEGIGIDEAEIDRVFERFYRTKDAKDLFSTGSGLGLSIVKNSIELLGGKFGVESKKNVGSKFWISLARK
jgi:two-component system phosphate regulon sensor histidine kinase PhoR